MPSYNKTIIIGHMARDPELRYTQGGAAINKFTVAVGRKWKTADGEQREDTAWVDVTAFGKQAETISQYFSKGKPILVEGRLHTDSWEDKNTGQKRSKLCVVLESFGFIGDSGGGKQQPATKPKDEPQEPLELNSPEADDDVPF